MDVQFTPDQQHRLARLAEAQGRDAQDVVREAVDRFLNYGDWFAREVDEGVAAAERGEFVEHEAIRRLIKARYRE